MDKMAITRKGLRYMLAGVIVMIAGFILMTGPTPVKEVFNPAMFDWRRLVAAPLLILAGIVVIIISIMGNFKDKEEKK